MTAYEDLNNIIQHYNISRSGIPELQELQTRLSEVPVSLVQFRKYLKTSFHNCELSDLAMRAELIKPESRIFLLDDLVDHDEADELTERMVHPYVRISMSGNGISKRFHASTRNKLGKLILPDKRDQTSRVLSRPDCPAVAIIYERENKIHYLEIGFCR